MEAHPAQAEFKEMPQRWKHVAPTLSEQIRESRLAHQARGGGREVVFTGFGGEKHEERVVFGQELDSDWDEVRRAPSAPTWNQGVDSAMHTLIPPRTVYEPVTYGYQGEHEHEETGLGDAYSDENDGRDPEDEEDAYYEEYQEQLTEPVPGVGGNDEREVAYRRHLANVQATEATVERLRVEMMDNALAGGGPAHAVPQTEGRNADGSEGVAFPSGRAPGDTPPHVPADGATANAIRNTADFRQRFPRMDAPVPDGIQRQHNMLNQLDAATTAAATKHRSRPVELEAAARAALDREADHLANTAAAGGGPTQPESDARHKAGLLADELLAAAAELERAGVAGDNGASARFGALRVPAACAGSTFFLCLRWLLRWLHLR